MPLQCDGLIPEYSNNFCGGTMGKDKYLLKIPNKYVKTDINGVVQSIDRNGFAYVYKNGIYNGKINLSEIDINKDNELQ